MKVLVIIVIALVVTCIVSCSLAMINIVGDNNDLKTRVENKAKVSVDSLQLEISKNKNDAKQ